MEGKKDRIFTKRQPKGKYSNNKNNPTANSHPSFQARSDAFQKPVSETPSSNILISEQHTLKDMDELLQLI